MSPMRPDCFFQPFQGEQKNENLFGLSLNCCLKDADGHLQCSKQRKLLLSLKDEALNFAANLSPDIRNDTYMFIQALRESYFCNEEGHISTAHGPWLAHLSDIATADMQMLCNIFPILSSQLMKRSSFEQFLVLEKNIWA